MNTNTRIPIKLLVGIGTEFQERGRDCVVTRVTDLDFDTLDKESGTVVVRSLGVWEWSEFTNRLSGVRKLLRMPQNGQHEWRRF